MKSVASRELRNNTRALLEKVEAGQSIAITVDGRAVATIEPIGRTQRWMPREEFVRQVLARQADPGLAREIRELSPESTGDLDLE